MKFPLRLSLAVLMIGPQTALPEDAAPAVRNLYIVESGYWPDRRHVCQVTREALTNLGGAYLAEGAMDIDSIKARLKAVRIEQEKQALESLREDPELDRKNPGLIEKLTAEIKWEISIKELNKGECVLFDKRDSGSETKFIQVKDLDLVKHLGKRDVTVTISRSSGIEPALRPAMSGITFGANFKDVTAISFPSYLVKAVMWKFKLMPGDFVSLGDDD